MAEQSLGRFYVVDLAHSSFLAGAVCVLVPIFVSADSPDSEQGNVHGPADRRQGFERSEERRVGKECRL